eukprot:TRINITY_DN5132_c0_g1_i1.p1 TRINITY_DN5132_c0_g1~~TRINITY_DN5132_c0_g1_i1.p1  ORF type:complete len:963 (-),score=223.46 TRINITY_DN5132_c0_g1_i1:118-3006(-)
MSASSTTVEKPCTVLIHYDKGEPPALTELRTQLETGNTELKADALKKVILYHLNGEPLPQLLMTIIRFVLPSRDHTIKKLLLLYWEIIEKTNPDGKLKPEMILVCNNLRNDLIHPNEYIRGCTLRLMCKLKEPEVLEPLLPSVRQNLEHRHVYVRRNAVLAIYSVYKSFDYLIPDAPDLVYNFLVAEGDPSCKRNAFIMLFNCAQDRAVEYLASVLDQVAAFGDMLQFIVVELIRKVCRTNPGERSKYIKCIFTLLGSPSSAVQFEAAGTLLSLSSAPTAVRAAASTFISLLCSESDNNVKMIILDRLLDIKRLHSKVLQDLLMDILRALASPSLDIRKKTLDIVLDLVSTKNIDEVMLVFKKEINKTQAKEYEKAGEYRQMLIQAIHQCAVRFPDVASSVVHLLMDFLGDPNIASAVDVIIFVREVIETYPALRDSITRKLIESLFQVKASKVFRSSMWIIGEYSSTAEDIEVAFQAIKDIIGELPFTGSEKTDAKEESSRTPKSPTVTPVSSSGTRVLADGTYATQSALAEVQALPVVSPDSNTTLRTLITNGDFFLASAIGTALVKLCLKTTEKAGFTLERHNTLIAEAIRILTAILQLGKSGIPPQPIDLDSADRIAICIRALTEFEADPKLRTSMKRVWLRECKEAFTHLLSEQKESGIGKADEKKRKMAQSAVQADDLIKIRQLRGKKALLDIEEEEDTADVSKAIGLAEQERDQQQKLHRIFQLTGLSDPVYAEAYVNVHQYDIVLEVTVMNQTSDTLQNVSLELATLGDLKLVERPQTYTVGPREKLNIKANIKVSSTETGIIFGNIVYDVAGQSASDKNCVVLNEIHIDIMDYISPAECTDVQFRTMWAEFEWENKVVVNTNITDVNQFLQHIMKTTNMACMTPASALAGDCGFLSANLYAKSVFGEDALSNICVERQADGKLSGYIRIRSKTQGIALSLGDKITLKQKLQED